MRNRMELVELDNGYSIEVVVDDSPTNPIEEFDNACTIWCLPHPRYNLGTKDGRDKAVQAVRESRNYKPYWEDLNSRSHTKFDLSVDQDLALAMARCGNDIVSLSLYLYDHSGLALSTKPFTCKWDSMSIGIAFMSRKDVIREYGLDTQGRVSRQSIEAAKLLIQAEVDTYANYVAGEVYGVIVWRGNVEVDSVYGLYGMGAVENHKAEAMKTIEADIEEQNKKPIIGKLP